MDLGHHGVSGADVMLHVDMDQEFEKDFVTIQLQKVTEKSVKDKLMKPCRVPLIHAQVKSFTCPIS